MKKQIRFTLLFALALALLLGALIALPLSASATAADTYTLTVKVVKPDGTLIESYGEIRQEGGVSKSESTLTYTASAGTNIVLTASPNGYYTFFGWKRSLDATFTLGDENNTVVESLIENATIYAVFEPVEYKIYYVGAKGTPESSIPAAILAKYGTDVEYHPSYLKIVSPNKHVYGTATAIPQAYTNEPGKTQSHTFLSWKAYSESGVEIDLENGKIPADTNCEIYLVPQWIPMQFDITCYDRAGTPDSFAPLGQYSVPVNYGVSVSGKDFGGQRDYVGYEFNAADEANYTEIVVGVDADTAVYRYYTPCQYTVHFDPALPSTDAELAERGTEEITVIYQQSLPEKIDVPSCTGYVFLGYYLKVGTSDRLYYDQNGNVGAIKFWVLPRDETLFAKWELQKHDVVVNVVDENGNPCNDAVKVLINGSAASGALDFGTEVVVEVKVRSGQNKKLTKWNGVAIAHVTTVTETFVIGEETLEITAQLLPNEAVPALNVNYASEKLEGFLPGTYQITVDEVSWNVVVSATGAVTSIGPESASAVSVSTLFGKTLSIIRLGVADQTADGEPQALALSARPAAIAADKVVYSALETKQARSLIFQVPNSLYGTYEIAYTTSLEELPQNWTTDLCITNLEVGVPYTVYLRARANDSAPHGDATIVLMNYEFSRLVDVKPLFILLLCLLALQILALVFLLISRRRARMNAVAAPLAALLAIKLIPAGVFPWVIVLTIAVVALQVVLVVMALQTGVIWQKRTKDAEDPEREDTKKTSEDSEFTLFGDAPEQPKQPEEETGDQDRDQDQPE